MSKEKQIEEMFNLIVDGVIDGEDNHGVPTGKTCFDIAESLYNAGYRNAVYRKQSGWISVDERLPERNGRYLTHCKIEGQSLVCVLYYCNVGGFNEGTVTHWMPLPEPPVMKGGE